MAPEPTATYRMQFQPGFGFEEAEKAVPYLAKLGVSHLYASPYLQAARGSMHGYDVVDPSRVNEELGGAVAHRRLCRKLDEAGLGQMIDIVPNHMAIAGRQNPWWWDVLEDGPSSRYATYFDVDWEASEARWPNKVLLPVLANHYGRVLEDGQFRLSHDKGEFVLHYQDHAFPVDPSSLADLLGRAAESCGSEMLAFLAESHARLPRPTVTARQDVERRHRDKAVLLELRAAVCGDNPEVRSAIDAETARLNCDPDAMDALLEQQNYRLAFWRAASGDLGYRRFFDIKELVGLRAEDIEVFRATHALPIAWAKKGWVQGLRIDHPDGLRDPTEYFRRLREVCPDAWIVVEKILLPGERLPSDWPVSGTTGYDFLNMVTGLFIDPDGKRPMTRLYEKFTGEQASFKGLSYACKRLVLTELLGSDLNRLASLFVCICEQHRRQRDYTRHELREVLCETAACFPVYRSYVSASRNYVGHDDQRRIAQAIDNAVASRSDLDPELFQFLKDLLLLRVQGALEGELPMRFQQLTGPAMAKGLEDTALYRSNRLVALNEVGGDPDQFGVSPEKFHQTCAAALLEHPLGLLSTTTHDTKRSGDVRARLALLSEIPDQWAGVVERWTEYNERHRTGNLPDRNTEYLLYQTLVGAWPIDAERIAAYMEKAVREAKVHTSWINQNEEYEGALRSFVRDVMEDELFLADLRTFVDRLAMPGRINSLAQNLLKLTAPGVPDIYQGTELWDLSLVDPDNRKPVDFDARMALLEELPQLSPEDIMSRMDEGLPKLWLISQALHLRREQPKLFGPTAAYRPLYAQGPKAAHLVAFIRGEGAVTLVPRLVMRLRGDWAETEIELPKGRWTNILSGDEVEGATIRLDKLLARFPVALLVLEAP